MRNNKDDTNKIVLGAIVGGLVGGVALYLLKRSDSNPLLGKITRAISEVGDAIEESRIDDTDDALDEIEDSIPNGDHVVDNVLTWVATGLSLWKKLKR